MRLNKAIFLDRDGVLNRDSGYLYKIEDWQWLPGALAGLRLFKEAGYSLIVASNQSGIGRGYYSKDQLDSLENWLNNELQSVGCPIDAWYYCPHLPEAGCLCRKPLPGMLLKAAKDLNIDLPRSWMLGDKISDVEAGLAAGCRAGLIGPRIESALFARPDVFCWPNLLIAAKKVIEMDKNPKGQDSS